MIVETPHSRTFITNSTTRKPRESKSGWKRWEEDMGHPGWGEKWERGNITITFQYLIPILNSVKYNYSSVGGGLHTTLTSTNAHIQRACWPKRRHHRNNNEQSNLWARSSEEQPQKPLYQQRLKSLVSTGGGEEGEDDSLVPKHTRAH